MPSHNDSPERILLSFAELPSAQQPASSTLVADSSIGGTLTPSGAASAASVGGGLYNSAALASGETRGKWLVILLVEAIK
jgi:hypothetical protein